MKENITPPKLQSPKIIGNVELPKRSNARAKEPSADTKKGMPQPVIKSVGGMRPLHWCNFPISLWSVYLDICKKANKKIKTDGGSELSITISKKAFNQQHKLDETLGSVWYACGSKVFRDNFRRPLTIKLNEDGLHRITREQARTLNNDVIFYILFINEQCLCEVIECQKTEDQGDLKSLSYRQLEYKSSGGLHGKLSSAIYRKYWNEIKEEGSGVWGDDEFWLYVSEEITI